MDEQREAQEELEALERDVDDLRREQEAEDRFWTEQADRAWAESRAAERTCDD